MEDIHERIMNCFKQVIKDSSVRKEHLLKLSYMLKYLHSALVSGNVDFKKIDYTTLTSQLIAFLEVAIRYFENETFPFDDEFKKSLSIISIFFEIDEISKNLMPVLEQYIESILDPSVEFWVCYELVISFESILPKLSADLKDGFYKNHVIKLYKLMDNLNTCGDYVFQENYLRLIFGLLPDQKCNENVAYHFFPDDALLAGELQKIRPETFHADCRNFLNCVNEKTKTVVSIKAKSVCGDAVNVLPPPFYESEKGIWVDFNTKSESVTIICAAKSFTTDLLATTLHDTILINKSIIESINVKSMKRQQIITINLNADVTMNTNVAESFKKKCRVINILLEKTLQQQDLVNSYLPDIFGGLFLGNKESTTEMDRVKQAREDLVFPPLKTCVRSGAPSNLTSLSELSYPTKLRMATMEMDDDFASNSSNCGQEVANQNVLISDERIEGTETNKSMMVQFSSMEQTKEQTSTKKYNAESFDSLPPTLHEIQLSTLEMKSRLLNESLASPTQKALERIEIERAKMSLLETLGDEEEENMVKVSVPKTHYKKIAPTHVTLASILEDSLDEDVEENQELHMNSKTLVAESGDNYLDSSYSDCANELHQQSVKGKKKNIKKPKEDSLNLQNTSDLLPQSRTLIQDFAETPIPNEAKAGKRAAKQLGKNDKQRSESPECTEKFYTAKTENSSTARNRETQFESFDEVVTYAKRASKTEELQATKFGSKDKTGISKLSKTNTGKQCDSEIIILENTDDLFQNNTQKLSEQSINFATLRNKDSALSSEESPTQLLPTPADINKNVDKNDKLKQSDDSSLLSYESFVDNLRDKAQEMEVFDTSNEAIYINLQELSQLAKEIELRRRIDEELKSGESTPKKPGSESSEMIKPRNRKGKLVDSDQAVSRLTRNEEKIRSIESNEFGKSLSEKHVSTPRLSKEMHKDGNEVNTKTKRFINKSKAVKNKDEISNIEIEASNKKPERENVFNTEFETDDEIPLIMLKTDEAKSSRELRGSKQLFGDGEDKASTRNFDEEGTEMKSRDEKEQKEEVASKKKGKDKKIEILREEDQQEKVVSKKKGKGRKKKDDGEEEEQLEEVFTTKRDEKEELLSKEKEKNKKKPEILRDDEKEVCTTKRNKKEQKIVSKKKGKGKINPEILRDEEEEPLEEVFTTKMDEKERMIEEIFLKKKAKGKNKLEILRDEEEEVFTTNSDEKEQIKEDALPKKKGRGKKKQEIFMDKGEKQQEEIYGDEREQKKEDILSKKKGNDKNKPEILRDEEEVILKKKGKGKKNPEILRDEEEVCTTKIVEKEQKKEETLSKKKGRGKKNPEILRDEEEQPQQKEVFTKNDDEKERMKEEAVSKKKGKGKKNLEIFRDEEGEEQQEEGCTTKRGKEKLKLGVARDREELSEKFAFQNKENEVESGMKLRVSKRTGLRDATNIIKNVEQKGLKRLTAEMTLKKDLQNKQLDEDEREDNLEVFRGKKKRKVESEESEQIVEVENVLQKTSFKDVSTNKKELTKEIIRNRADACYKKTKQRKGISVDNFDSITPEFISGDETKSQTDLNKGLLEEELSMDKIEETEDVSPKLDLDTSVVTLEDKWKLFCQEPKKNLLDKSNSFLNTSFREENEPKKEAKQKKPGLKKKSKDAFGILTKPAVEDFDIEQHEKDLSLSQLIKERNYEEIKSCAVASDEIDDADSPEIFRSKKRVAKAQKNDGVGMSRIEHGLGLDIRVIQGMVGDVDKRLLNKQNSFDINEVDDIEAIKVARIEKRKIDGDEEMQEILKGKGKKPEILRDVEEEVCTAKRDEQEQTEEVLSKKIEKGKKKPEVLRDEEEEQQEEVVSKNKGKGTEKPEISRVGLEEVCTMKRYEEEQKQKEVCTIVVDEKEEVSSKKIEKDKKKPEIFRNAQEGVFPTIRDEQEQVCKNDKINEKPEAAIQKSPVDLNQANQYNTGDSNLNSIQINKEIFIDNDVSIIEPAKTLNAAEKFEKQYLNYVQSIAKPVFKVPQLKSSQSEVNLREAKSSKRKLFDFRDVDRILAPGLPKRPESTSTRTDLDSVTSKKRRVDPYCFDETFDVDSKACSESNSRKIEEMFRDICESINKRKRKSGGGLPSVMPKKRLSKRSGGISKRVAKTGKGGDLMAGGSKVQILQDVTIGGVDRAVINEYGEIIHKVKILKNTLTGINNMLDEIVVDLKTKGNKTVLKK